MWDVVRDGQTDDQQRRPYGSLKINSVLTLPPQAHDVAATYLGQPVRPRTRFMCAELPVYLPPRDSRAERPRLRR